jgi:magnesium-transporting ATPase (P-type)
VRGPTARRIELMARGSGSTPPAEPPRESQFDRPRESNLRWNLGLVRHNLFVIFNLDLIGLAIAQILLDRWLDAVVTIGTLVLNTVLNVVQESLAFRQLRRLSALAPPELSVSRLADDQLAPVRATTPLQVAVRQLLRLLLIIAWAAAAWLLLNLFLEPPGVAQKVGQAYLDAISIIFSVAPPGLFFMVTLTHFFTVGSVARFDVLLKASVSAEALAYVGRIQATEAGLLTDRSPLDPPGDLTDLDLETEIVTVAARSAEPEPSPGESVADLLDPGLALLTRGDPPRPDRGGPSVVIVPMDASAEALVDSGVVLMGRGIGSLVATIARCRRSIAWLADVLALTLAQVGYLLILSLIPILGLAGLPFPAAANGVVTILTLTIPGLVLFLMQGPTRSDPATIVESMFRFAVPAAIGVAAATLTTHVTATLLGQRGEDVLLASSLTLMIMALSLVLFVRPPWGWWAVRTPAGPVDARSFVVVGLMVVAYLVLVRIPLAQEAFKVAPLLDPAANLVVALTSFVWIVLVREALRRGWTNRASTLVRSAAERS